MANRLYRKQVTSVVDEFRRIDQILAELAACDLQPERARINDLLVSAEQAVKRCDSTPLPASVIPAAKATADCAWLLAELCRPQAGELADNEPIAVSNKIAKTDDHWTQDTRVALDSEAFGQVLNYREKAYELLQKPAQDYNLSLGFNAQSR